MLCLQFSGMDVHTASEQTHPPTISAPFATA